VFYHRSKPRGAAILNRHSHHLSGDVGLASLTSLIFPPPTTFYTMRGLDSFPSVPADESDQLDRALSERLPPANRPGSNARRDQDVLPVPHLPKERRSECDRRIDDIKHGYEHLLREKDVRIGELKSEKDAQIEGLRRERDERLEELTKERDLRIEEIKEEKEARIGEVKREKDERIEELKREKDARIEEVKRDREAAIRNMDEQLERTRREELQLREENNRLKDEVMRLKIELGRAGLI